jgi:hypothetical protein
MSARRSSPAKSPASALPAGFLPRRSFLELGMGAALWAGVGLPFGARAFAAAKKTGKPRAKTPRARACILLYMEGGPSQLDTFDPKPGCPTGGPFKAIETNVKGVRISEHLPLLARQMKRLCLIRSLTSREGNHDRARHLMHTGYPPQGGVDHPAFGSVVAAMHDARSVPGYVAIGGPGEDAGFLDAAFSPFPVLDPTKPTRNLGRAGGVDDGRFDARLELWRTLQTGFAADHPGVLASGQRAVGEQAVSLMRSPSVAAFDIASEPDAVKKAYGDSPFGAGCLMARRLVADGIPFVEVLLRGWDTHEQNFPRVTELSKTLDQAMSALLDDLAARGLLNSTLVMWMGDFGRTPVINDRGGRDHFPTAGNVVLAGGGIKGAQVIGETNAAGDEIVTRPVSVPDLYRSVAWAMSVDADKTRFAPSGRPVKTVDGGTLISELF